MTMVLVLIIKGILLGMYLFGRDWLHERLRRA